MTDAWPEDAATEIVTSRGSWAIPGRSLDAPETKVLTIAMSIYAQLVSQALDGEASRGRTAGEAFAELLGCRGRLQQGVASRTVPGWASSAVADQLAYDVALIVFARHHDIECSPVLFEHPQQERLRLEQGLASRGVRFDDPAGLDGLA
jgi:hypothetical protein